MIDRLSDTQLRRIAAALGLATVAFGATPLAAPAVFARFFGFPKPDASTAAMMRSLGVRDVVMGMGLWSAAAHSGNYAPWLLARLLTDGGDTLAVGIGAGAGHRNGRFLALGALALGAAAGDALLWAAARRARIL
ncbi:MAG TPA: DUF4267 domain-containing protein [Ktedonobacterales bacterium]|nr:DUF4267 domain-containing protein [Ktedonobacterales bacterium]